MKAGYTFKGWYADPDFVYLLVSISPKTHKDITVYAKWEKIVLANEITAKDLSATAKKKAQKVKLVAKEKYPTGLTYTTDNAKVIVDATGNVTIPAKFSGVVTITISSKATADYSAATKTVTLSVAPEKLKKYTLSSGAKSLTVSWKKSTYANGYEVWTSTDKKFKKAKITKTSKLKCTVKKLTSGKKYYVKVRAYKKSGKKYAYSAFGPTKNVVVR